MSDPSAEFHRLYRANARPSSIASYYGLTADEMGRALHYARIAKVMKLAEEKRQKQADLAKRLAAASALPAAPNRIWCVQCERRVSPDSARACSSQFCKARAVAA